jgi:hypothetical protein
MSLSHNPHPAIEVLLQTNVKPQFDRAMTARSKTFSRLLLSAFIRAKLLRLPSFAWISVKHFALCSPLPTSLSQLPHPGVRLLLQTKAQVIFNSLMTALSKPLFPAAFAVDLAEC